MKKTKQDFTENQQLIKDIENQNQILRELAEKFQIHENVEIDNIQEIEKEENNLITN